MKKFVSLLLVLMFSFGMVSTVRQEKVEAASVALGYAVFKAGIAFTGFATYAGWLYANGYTQPIQEMIVGYANKYYDYSNGVFTEKVDKMNILDKFNLYTSALITGNLANLPNANDLKEMQNELSEAFPQRLNMDNFTYDEMFYNAGTLYNTTLLEYSGGYYNFKSEYSGKIIKHVLNLSSYPDFYYYIKMSPVGWYQTGSQFYPIAQVIQADGKVINIKMRNILQMINYSSETQTFDLVTRDTKTTEIIATYAGMLKANYGLTIPVEYGVTAGSYARGEHDFVFTNPNYYSLLNGLATSADDLPNLLNTDEYLQREVSKALENSNVNEESPAIAPAIGSDGMVYYPGTETIPDNPDIPYNPGQTWYENLFNKVGAIPDLFIGGITDLWDNTLVPKLDNIRDSILEIPTKLDLIWEWIIDFPDLIYDFFVPTLPAISETWQPVTDLFNQKIFPVIQPFQNIGFYEEELQDISADIKIGQYQGNHKIIDYSYLKSVREPIKSVIRSFFWILIIFFNLDQVHRLIRNQSIVKTYIRKVDEPGGNK